MSEWAWIGLAMGGVMILWGVLFRLGVMRAGFVTMYRYGPWYRRNAAFASIPFGLMFVSWAVLPVLDRMAPFGVWLAVMMMSLVALILGFVVLVHPPWWIKPRWLRMADADEWRHPPGPDSRIARTTIVAIIILAVGSTCGYIVTGSPNNPGVLLIVGVVGAVLAAVEYFGQPRST